MLDILKNFILFSGDSQQPIKILAGYHQYFAVKKAIEKAKIATKTDGKGGVFWHTQGSGKSLSMVFYAHLLQEVPAQICRKIKKRCIVFLPDLTYWIEKSDIVNTQSIMYLMN